MFENAIYSVISPEGCASILWRDPSKSLEAAQAMKLTAKELLKKQIIDEIIKEPVGGAHRNRGQAITSTRNSLIKYLEEYKNFTRKEILEQRKQKFLDIGKRKTFTVFPKDTSWEGKNNFFNLIKKILFKFKKELIIITIIILLSFLFLF